MTYMVVPKGAEPQVLREWGGSDPGLEPRSPPAVVVREVDAVTGLKGREWRGPFTWPGKD
jgi:hypothetical protein